MQFVVALLMLWIAILMPFILLQVFLDFLAKYEFGKVPGLGQLNTLQNRVIDNNFSFLKRPPQPDPTPARPFPAGEARELPRENVTTREESIVKRVATIIPQQQEAGQPIKQASYTQFGGTTRNMQTINQIQQNTTPNARQTTQVIQRPIVTVQLKPEILARQTTRLVSFPIPTMRDIVKFETARLTRIPESTHELQQMQETLQKIANPQTGTTSSEKQHYVALREQLTQETTKGDVLAKSILSAASTVQKPQVIKTGEATTMSVPQTSPVVNLPVVNQIQTVSFDDYEAVKDLWLENYQKIDIPSDKYSDRKSWIEDDGKTISQAITLLSSPDPMRVKEGLSSVSAILPFLLIGGFSQTEVIAYLKAKLAAGKAALQELAQTEENQETLLQKGTKKDKLKQLSEKKELDEEDEKDQTG
jgi:hypothetical protein